MERRVAMLHLVKHMLNYCMPYQHQENYKYLTFVRYVPTGKPLRTKPLIVKKSLNMKCIYLHELKSAIKEAMHIDSKRKKNAGKKNREIKSTSLET